MTTIEDRAFPRYPVYVPTRGRAATPYTVGLFLRDHVPFKAVVVPSEVDVYAEVVGADNLLVLPSDDYILRDSRNWIKDHSTAAGDARHWQIDDNIQRFRYLHRQRRIPCHSGLALRACEDFTDRFDNVAVSGLTYENFVVPGLKVPFRPNVHVYSMTLVNNAIPHRWRLILNDDTDFCLQVLADGWTTILVNQFMGNKTRTMVLPGGNTDALYQGDGRLKMARALERMWPGVVRVDRRYGRPQHVIDWTKFTTPLQPKPRSEWPPVDYRIRLEERRPVKSELLRGYLADQQ